MNKQTRMELIDRIVQAAHRPCPDIVESFMCRHKQTRKDYSPYGMPFGSKADDYEHVSVGFVFRSKDGTTYGQRHVTRESLQAKHDLWQSHSDHEFRTQLEAMTDAEIQSQADYWLKTVTVKPSLGLGFRLSISGRDRNNIKEYISECFSYCLDQQLDEEGKLVAA